jgi:hypothetical protein
MLEVEPAKALTDVDAALGNMPDITDSITTGHAAANQVIQLMSRTQQRLSPETIIEADDPTLGPTARSKRLWDNDDIRQATVESLADSVRVLAALWTAAWKAAGGPALGSSAFAEFSKAELNKVVRQDRKFVPSLSLDEMAESGDFEPPASAAGKKKPAPKNSPNRANRKKAKRKSSRKKK